MNRERLERVYAEALDNWEHRLFGTRSHVAAIEWRNERVRFWVQQHYLLGLSVIHQKSPLIITSIA